MKNINNNHRETAFYPCGIKIPKDEIFASPRNLGLALMEALTGIPAEDLELNRSYISIGLGCFALIGIDHDWDRQFEKVNELDVNEGWMLNAAVDYELGSFPVFEKIKVKRLPHMSFTIDPEGLLSDKGAATGAIHVFGPARLLKRLHSPETRFEVVANWKRGIADFVEDDDVEWNDAVLTPSEFEFDLFREESDPEKKFRILLNMITAFASTVSCKLMVWGRVSYSTLSFPAEELRNELAWAENGIEDAWVPSVQEAQEYMAKKGLKRKDISPYIQKLIWGEAIQEESDGETSRIS